MILSLTFDKQSKFVLYGDPRRVNVLPISIEDIYSKLNLVSGGESLSTQEWNFYIKGNLERPY